MACLNNSKIQEYLEGDLTAVEKSRVRDHLIVCAECRAQYNNYEKLEKNLLKPVYFTPPSIIEKNVLRMLFPRIPSYSSIFALLAASFLLLISAIYIYFDFANNSMIQAIQLSSHDTSNWIASIIKTISTVFSVVYAVFKTINAFFEIVFKINIGMEIIAISVLILLSLGFYSFSHLLFKKIKGSS